MADSPYDAIVLVSFGGPEGPDDVIPFLENVTAGRNIPRERLAVVGEHYAYFDGVSPINEQCRRQQSALQTALIETGLDLPVYWGNRNWHPFLADTVEQMAEDGIRRALAIFTSAYSSYSGCRQYRENLIAARETVADRRPDLTVPEIDKVRAYYDHPGFLEPFIDATNHALATHGPEAEPTLLFTAHSIPSSMAAVCDYEIQLREAMRIVCAALPRPDLPAQLVWQSRSGPPQVPWLEPDVNDVIEQLADEGVTAVVIIPIGFVSDHIEVMWDLDTEAVQTAERVGIEVSRAISPGTGPVAPFIDMWVDLIGERIAAEIADDPTVVARAALGGLEVRPDVCRVNCCPPPQRPAGRPTS
ncbi:MAG: ferrochelatase [Actinomycetota bacterium]